MCGQSAQNGNASETNELFHTWTIYAGSTQEINVLLSVLE